MGMSWPDRAGRRALPSHKPTRPSLSPATSTPARAFQWSVVMSAAGIFALDYFLSFVVP
jgi:hypothetical protein